MTGRVVLAALLVFASGVYAASVAAPRAQAQTAADSGGGCTTTVSGGSSGGGGSVSGDTITMWAQLTEQSQTYLCQGTSTYGTGSNWQPPQCWWAPEYTPPQLAGAIGSLATNGGSADETYTELTQEYAAGGTGAQYTAGYTSTSGPPWERFNVDAPGYQDGDMWWGLVWNEDITLQGMNDCTAIDTQHFPEDWYWVTPTTGTPDPGDAPVLDGQELADYVAGKVRLNPVVVDSSPNLSANTKTTVGLPTWLWAYGGGNTVVKHQICTTPEYGDICVYLVAQAKSSTILTGDPAAKVFADCRLNTVTGYIGKAYAGGTGNPPCGITFETPGTWPIALDTTWNVKISWAGGALTPQPPPETETDLNAVVQAIQAVNY